MTPDPAHPHPHRAKVDAPRLFADRGGAVNELHDAVLGRRGAEPVGQQRQLTRLARLVPPPAALCGAAGEGMVEEAPLPPSPPPRLNASRPLPIPLADEAGMKRGGTSAPEPPLLLLQLPPWL